MKKTMLMIVPVLLSGCFFESYREPVRYALTCPPIPGAIRVRADEFNDRSGAERRIRFRETDGRILTDPAALWSQSPGELVPNTINAAFADAPPQAPVRRIGGTLDRFEADPASLKFHLAGSYRFRDGVQEYFFNLAVPMKSAVPADAAEAASRAVSELAAAIQTQATQPEQPAKP